MPTPTWSAARAGVLGDPGANNASNQVNQFLGTHGITPIYQGNGVLTPNGTGYYDAFQPLTLDIAQPFTMSGTTIGRVAIPVLPVGNGADLVVSLCTNNAGVPGTVINRTRVPASWTYQLSAIEGIGPSGTPSSDLFTEYTDNPLATATSNPWHIGPWTQNQAWSFPSVGQSALYPSSYTVIGDYLISVGGVDVAHQHIANVFSFQFDGAALGMAQAQPSLPQPLFSAAVTATSDTVICMGGDNNTTTLNTVYTANWDAGLGRLGAWAQQAPLPQALDSVTSSAATWNDSTVYIAGGNNSSGIQSSAVYYAQVQNGQITAWNTGPSLPAAISFPSVAVIGNLLVVSGGTPATTAVTGATYYAPINADGSLGAWQTGPTSPVGTAGGVVALDTALLIVGGYTNPSFTPTNDVQSLAFDNGPGEWQRGTFFTTLPSASTVMVAAFPIAAGRWQLFVTTLTSYYTATLSRTRHVSVPLPTTGLTNGATYHIVIQEASADLSNYLRLSADFDAFPGNPTYLYSNAGNWIWTAFNPGYAIPIQIYDLSTTGPLWHLYSDGGARLTTTVYATTPEQNLLGILEATQQPGPVLNMNPTFTAGTLPWGGNNGTIAQSNAFTHGNLPFSARFTPTGGIGQAYIESELMTIGVQQQYTANCWFYSPTGYSNCEIIINWYNASGFSGGFISSSTGATTNVPAGVWTPLTVSGSAPTSAVYGTVGVYERGTPPATAVFYASAATLQPVLGPQLPSAASVRYADVWPNSGMWPPLGVDQLV